MADELGVTIAFSPEPGSLPAWGDPTQSASVSLDGRPAGHLGLLSAKAGEKLGLKEAGGRVYAFEIDIDGLPPEKAAVFKLWSNYPGVTRDMAVLLDRNVPASEVLAALSADPALPLARATIFDLYQGGGIPPYKKSLAMRLFFRESTRTLTDEEVNGYFNGIVLSLKKLFSAELRG